MAQGVTPEVKNAAMKQLFTDPHYNVMDGLDTYIDDYSKPDPIPESMLRNMVSAQFLKLFEEEEKDADVAKAVRGQCGMMLMTRQRAIRGTVLCKHRHSETPNLGQPRRAHRRATCRAGNRRYDKPPCQH